MNGMNVRDEKNKVIGGVLYLVATPIGNLADTSERAIKVLSEVDMIAAEDTRNSLKFLNYFGISKPMVSYFEHNKKQRGPEIVASLKAGKSWALITDAGTPAISDPGEDLVCLCAQEGVTVTSIPGASAVVNALALSALPTRRFIFEGFLEGKEKDRREYLTLMKNEKRTMIFYESPHDLVSTLVLMQEVFGEKRRVSLCRELTKLNEEIMRVTFGEAVLYYQDHAPRGEYVLVVEGAPETNDGEFFVNMTVEEHVEHYISLGLSKMDAIKQTAKDRGVPKGVIYKAIIAE